MPTPTRIRLYCGSLKDRMVDHEDNYSSIFKAQSNRRQAWLKALSVCAVMGSAYGAAMGAIIFTMDGAATLIGIAAVLMAVICAIPGTRYGFFFGYVNRIQFGRSFVGTVAAIFGAVVGGFFGIVATMPLGAVMGAVGGCFCGRSIAQHDYRFRHGIMGVFLGACIGAVVLSLRQNKATMLPGTIWGTGIGAIVGSLLFLLSIGILCSLPRMHKNDRGISGGRSHCHRSTLVSRLRYP